MELKIASLIIVLVILTIFQDSVSNIISEMENEKNNNNTLDFFPMGRIHGGFRDGKIVRKIKRCPSMYTKSLNANICLRIPMTESSYNKAIAICQGTSGSLLKVEQVKIIDLNIIKSLSKHPIFRIDGKKDASGVWKTSDSQPVDFSDFPTFNPNRGIVGSTIVLVLSRKGPILYPAPSHFSFIQSFQFLPICSIEAELGNNIQNMENCASMPNFMQNVDRVVGGQDVPKMIPWQVAILSDGFQFCGGTILDSCTVLSASHCQISIHDMIRAGSINKHTGGQVIGISQVISHPGWDEETKSNDLVIVKLNYPLTMGKNVKPACLPSASYLPTNATENRCFTSGWGTLSPDGISPNHLQYVRVPAITTHQCNIAYGEGITDSMICAGYPNVGLKDSCEGDSGGPLVCNNGGNAVLAGVVSWGFGCADPEFPGVYARVTTALNWIQSNMGLCPPRPSKIPPPPPRPCKGKGDDWCDDENNDLECEWDGGDCCGPNVRTRFCKACQCLDPKFEQRVGQSNKRKRTWGCKFPNWKGDGTCEDENNNAGCEWDGGDCCGPNVNTRFCKRCQCLDPNYNRLWRQQPQKSTSRSFKLVLGDILFAKHKLKKQILQSKHKLHHDHHQAKHKLHHDHHQAKHKLHHDHHQAKHIHKHKHILHSKHPKPHQPHSHPNPHPDPHSHSIPHWALPIPVKHPHTIPIPVKFPHPGSHSKPHLPHPEPHPPHPGLHNPNPNLHPPLDSHPQKCPSKYSHVGSFKKDLCLSFLNSGATYKQALAICKESHGSLLRIEQLKFIDQHIVKTLAKFPIFRLDAKKDFNGHWKNSHSQFVDFSDFPNFDQHTGEIGDTIVWVLKPTGAILFPIHPELLSVNHFIFFPICSVAIIKADCSDKHPHCNVWAPKFCIDPNWSSWMAENCKKSCRLCKQQPSSSHQILSANLGSLFKTKNPATIKSPCKDIDPKCHELAPEFCQHHQWGSYMVENCKESCKICLPHKVLSPSNLLSPPPTSPLFMPSPPNPHCKDIKLNCELLAKDGFCQHASDFMFKNCKKSCGRC